jgi:hypothetical protein
MRSSVWNTGISFLESWVKFRAELITRVVGLDVGRNVFHALNRVEVALALATFLLTVRDFVAYSPGLYPPPRYALSKP